MTATLLKPGERAFLEAFLEDEYPETLQRRARILLLYDAGQSTREVAEAVQLSPGHVRRLRHMYQQDGLEAFPQREKTPVPAVEAQAEHEEAPLRIASPDEPPPLAETRPAAPAESQPEEAETLAAPEAPPEEPASVPADGETPGEPAAQMMPVAKMVPTLVQPAVLEKFIARLDKLKKPGVKSDDLLAEAGRKVIRYHFGQMLLHEQGTLTGEDIEELHDMRVATRRMRAAVEVFESAFHKKALKTHLKGLRATGRALGKVRDLDVFMEKAGHYQAELEPEKQTGLDPLMEAWQAERNIARMEMLNYLSGDRYARFKADFFTFLDTPGAGAVPVPDDPFEPTRVREIAPVLIYTRLASVRTFENILASASIEQFHALRIEFKKLRYTLEFFREVLGPEAKEVIEAVKQMQDHLGDLNDAQVATEILRDFLARWDLQQANLAISERRSPEPIMAYLTYRYTERHNLLLGLHQAWKEFNRPELRQLLALAAAAL